MRRVASLVALVALAGCGGLPQSAPALATQADRAPSSMARGAASGSLLYVSDLRDWDVHVYSFPTLKAVGKIAGLYQPQGLCGDAAGDVWVVNTQSNTIVEFAHGGTSPIATLADPVGYPLGCAVDPATGNLAVTDLYDVSGAGDVLVFKHAAGTPSVYANGSIADFYFAGYDAKSNLFVDGITKEHAFRLAELPKSGKALSLLAVSGGTIYFPGTVAWSGSSLVLGDQKCKNKAASCLYELSLAGKTAKITGTTPLGGACDVAEAWVGASQVAGGDYEGGCGGKRGGAEVWKFPGGGSPTAHATVLGQPVGAVVSS